MPPCGVHAVGGRHLEKDKKTQQIIWHAGYTHVPCSSKRNFPSSCGNYNQGDSTYEYI